MRWLRSLLCGLLVWEATGGDWFWGATAGWMMLTVLEALADRETP